MQGTNLNLYNERMTTRTNFQMMPGIDGAAFYQRLLVAWAGIFVAAILYCLLRSLVDIDYSYELSATIRWAIIQWGAWPILLPVCYYLIRAVERRLSFVAGLIVSAVFAVVGASLFAYFMEIALGGERSLYAATYHMAPIAGGTYLVLGMIAFWLLYPSAFSTAIREVVVADDETIELKVWKGQVQTKIDAALIEWARAARNYVEFHAGGKSYLMRASMAELERLLPEHRFLRTHRSYLVNKKFIIGVAGGSTRPTVVLESGFRLPVGKTYRHSIFAAIKPDIATAWSHVRPKNHFLVP